jgi:hypothetical protein
MDVADGFEVGEQFVEHILLHGVDGEHVEQVGIGRHSGRAPRLGLHQPVHRVLLAG